MKLHASRPSGINTITGSANAFNIYRDRPAYRRLQHNGMTQNFSWDHQVQKYEQLYSKLS